VIGRREFLAGVTLTGGAALVVACTPRPSPSYPTQSGAPFEGTGPFPSGVGSADPTPGSVLLWTRAHPERDRGDGILVAVELATTPGFGKSTVWEQTVLATAARDHCITVDATGLRPGTRYWYRFSYGGATSMVGRTRTAPEGGLDHMRIAAFSCQRWTQGWFTGHADLASLAQDPSTDVDLVLNLGDYVYDTGFADKIYVPGREDPVQDALTLTDFRSKYRMYRSDPNLQAMHAAYPVVSVFDNHDGMDGPTDPQRAGAVGAFFEHLPVRTSRPGRIDRSLRWGDLAELFLTDQRTFRDPTLKEDGALGTSSSARPEIFDPARTMLGAEQREWLLDGLGGSTARWKVLGSQLMVAPFRSFVRLPGQPVNGGVYFNLTQWDGYAAERGALLERLSANGATNTVVLSGDSHFFAASQMSLDVDDPDSPPLLVEISTGSMTSNNADENGYPTDEYTWDWVRSANPNTIQYLETERHGYAVVDLAPDEMTAELRSPRTVLAPTSTSEVVGRFRCRSGTQRLESLRVD
jgi:alkaline phosphatase D